MLLGPDRPTVWQASFKNDNYVIYCACVRISQSRRLKIATSAAWLSVLVKRGLQIVCRPKIHGCNWESSFGEVLAEAYHNAIL